MKIINNISEKKGREAELQLSLREYFIDLLKEEFDRLLLVTRKGYWIFKTLMDDDAWSRLKEEDPASYDAIRNRTKKIIYTDRYLNKCFDDKNEFQGKKIFIFDDTMTHGSNLFFYFSYLNYFCNDQNICESVAFPEKAVTVTPCVYGLSTEYPSEDAERKLRREFQRVIRNEISTEDPAETVQNYLKAFNLSLRYKKRFTSENLADLCVFETKLFHANLCPLVIDLPILSSRKKEGQFTCPAYMNCGTGEGIIMTKEQFKGLTAAGSEWTFERNYFEENYIENCSSYFVNSGIDFGNLNSVVHDFIVKCKYREEGDKVRLVFVPFAIFKSMTFSDIIGAFFSMWKDTGHGKEILNYIIENIQGVLKEKLREYPDIYINNLRDSDEMKELLKKNHNLCRNMYRSVIFYVSAYGGSLFREYLYAKAGLETDYDWDFMKESMSDEFIVSFKNLIHEKKNYRDCLMNIPTPDQVSPRGESLVKNEPKKIASKERLEKTVRKRIISKRNDESENLINRVYIFENIERDMEQEFLFKDAAEKRTLITMVLTDMLENSRIGNEIFIDNQNEIAYRGFKSGENSEVLFYKGLEYFYAYIYAFYYLSGENYGKDYSRFSEKLEHYLKNKGYLGHLLSEENMRFYEEYFGSLDDDRRDEQILNKRYVLNRYWKENDISGIKQFVDEAWKNVRVWLN